jgi:multiple sugar transport system substrate-binding protein
LFRASRHKKEAWALIEFLSRPEQQVRFWQLTGDLPARREAWSDSALANDPRVRSFETQLSRVLPAPRVPEWEQIATQVQAVAEAVIRGSVGRDSALARLDRDVDRILAKRRWLQERARSSAAQTTSHP